MSESGLTEQQLADLERRRDPETIPELVRTVRRLQHETDRLGLGLDVARRDREELRAALIQAQQRIRELETGDPP